MSFSEYSTDTELYALKLALLVSKGYKDPHH